ncbi:MAG: inositol monophosphatase family protein [Chloroflexi bacterium]|nr:inositol monophosphatase family protein [Chloroflexota bacterium]
MNPSPNELLDFALNAVWQAGRITLGYYQTGIEVEQKADNTPLTIADQLAEQKLRELITTRYPDHGIVGEEYGRTESNARYTWTLDPIDGTKSFVSGVPLYANLLALLDGDEAILGIINLPALNEIVYAVKGEGCYWNGRRCHVSNVDKLQDAVLLTSGLNYFGRKQAAWDALLQNSYIQRTWGDAYGYALVATGRAEIMVDPAMYLWDAAPVQVIIEEAGGTLTDWQGRPTIHHQETIATNGHLFEQVMARIGHKD